jgi:hypothetical protein
VNEAYVELEYPRAADGLVVTLVAALPTVRPIRIGGAPGELRLPGLPESASLATLSHAYDRFHVEPVPGAEPVTLNNRPLHENGAELSDGDTLEYRSFRLTLHESQPAEEPPLLDTPLRWKLRGSPWAELEAFKLEEASRPHIEEFELTVRPLLQAERYVELLRVATAEITRVVRLDEAEPLEAYVQYLWWMRIRASREANDPAAIDIAREGMALQGDFPPIAVACGTTFLTAQDFATARDAFQRGIVKARREHLPSAHDARLGRILALSLLAHPIEAAPPTSPETTPLIHLDTPGDEWLLWRMARYGRVFGDPDAIRYVFRGPPDEETNDTLSRQLWEIHDATRGLLTRRILIMPSLPLADPSLVIEAAGLRMVLEKADTAMGRCVIDLSHQRGGEPEIADAGPIEFDASAQAALPTIFGTGVPLLRLSESPQGMRLDLAPGPQRDDVVYRQGALTVAVAQTAARRYAGSRLTHASGWGGRFYLETTTGRRVGVRCRKPSSGRAVTVFLFVLAGLLALDAGLAIFRLAVFVSG